VVATWAGSAALNNPRHSLSFRSRPAGTTSPALLRSSNTPPRPSPRSAAATRHATAKGCPSWARCCASCRPSSEAASPSRQSAGSMKTLRLQRDPDGLFLWHPCYAPWIVGRHSGGANPNDRAFFDPKAGEIGWSNRDGMKDYEMEELAARHLVG